MKDLIRLVLFAIEFEALVVATIADIVIKIFSPFSRIGHRIEAWCENKRAKLATPKEIDKKEEPQNA